MQPALYNCTCVLFENNVEIFRFCVTPSMYLAQFGSVAQSCLTLCDPVDCNTPGFPVHHQPQNLLKLTSIKSVMSSNHLILCCPLLLLPSVFPSIRVFSKTTLESSPKPQFKNINSSALSFPYGPTLTSIHDSWKNHSFDYMDLCQQSNVSAF